MPKQTDPRRHNISKRVTTVTDLLTRDDVNDLLEDIIKRKDKIKHLVIIDLDEDELQTCRITQDTLISKAVYMLESAKFDIMNGDCEE